MNRVIKFRGKSIIDNTYGDWLHSSGIKYGDDVELMYCDEETSEEWNYIDKETLGQYTGLHDKNGKEIWENDIVEITREGIYEKGIIIFKNGCFFIKSKENLLALYNCELNNYKVKVIGNITDNPELLGGKDEC